MKRIILLLFISLLFVTEGFTKNRSQSEALDIAKSFYKSTPALRSTTSESLALAYICKDDISARSSDEKAYYYVFNVGGNGGFVIVSGDDEARDILGYSDAGNFDFNVIPDNFKNWLSFYQHEIMLLTENSDQIIHYTPDNETRSSFASSINPLLGGIMWDQLEPFNNYCPLVPTGYPYAGYRTATGCIATAMAQVMKYHRWPEKGKGSISYTTSSVRIPISVNFEGYEYQWDKMSDIYFDGIIMPEDNKDAVAMLMYHCGAAVKMNYYVSSGATSPDMVSALMTNFGYDQNAQLYQRDFYLRSEWENLIKTELNASRPVLYTGSSATEGHAFVCDGYDNNGLYHFNWGWSGMSNGYFELSALNPGSQGTGGSEGGYNISQSITTGVQKPDASTVAPPPQLITNYPLSVANTTISRTSNINATITQLFNVGVNSFSGTLGVMLLNEAGELKFSKGYSVSKLPPSNGYSSYPIISSIPTTVPNGNYKMYPAYTIDGVTWHPIRGKVGTSQYLNVVITTTNIVFSESTVQKPNLELNSLDIERTLYQNKTGIFNLEITNTGTGEYNSSIIVLIRSASNYTLNQTIITDPVNLIPGEKKSFSYSGVVGLKPGEYELIVYYDTYNNRDNFTLSTGATFSLKKTVTIEAEPTGTPALTLSTPISFDDNTKVYKEEATLTAKIKNTGGYFDSGLQVGFYTLGTLSSLNASLQYANPLLKANEEGIFQFTGKIDLDPGQYTAIIFSKSGNAWYEIPPYGTYSRVNFTLLEGRNPNGIDEAEVSQKLQIYPNPATDVIYFDSEEIVRTVRIIDVFGKQAFADHPNISGRVSVPVDGLLPGTYILQAETENGILLNKFIKK